MEMGGLGDEMELGCTVKYVGRLEIFGCYA